MNVSNKYLTAHPPFSTAVEIPPIYGSLQIRCTLTVEDSLPYFYRSSTLVYPRLPQGLMIGAKASTSFCLSTSRLPFFYLSTSSLPPAYLSTSSLPTSRLPQHKALHHT